ncbi:hypothetical protein CVT25_015930 [Psilocybe cyanescens]|uniref:Uncharacterized protein n=1 Tax=Psilocybe cyanescens TaxID=93625 RepID=A0A409WSC5_PSICY|nr:hypothetical protein CVT25_015930 [Psilocybe cyanescens]
MDESGEGEISDDVPRLKKLSLPPNLKILEISAKINLLSDGTLLKFIINRMNPSSSSIRAALENVTVIFERSAKLNIEEHVLEYAKFVGTINKIYLRREPIHAAYGLRGDNEYYNHDVMDEKANRLVPRPQVLAFLFDKMIPI